MINLPAFSSRTFSDGLPNPFSSFRKAVNSSLCGLPVISMLFSSAAEPFMCILSPLSMKKGYRLPSLNNSHAATKVSGESGFENLPFSTGRVSMRSYISSAPYIYKVSFPKPLISPLRLTVSELLPPQADSMIIRKYAR